MAKRKAAKDAKPSRRAAPHSFAGRWRIDWMEQWDQDFVDEEVEGFFEFDADGWGAFQFGYVRGRIDYRMTTDGSTPRMDFSWDGSDEMEPAQGRGWAVVDRDQINGMIFFHAGDESKFTAVRLQSAKIRAAGTAPPRQA